MAKDDRDILEVLKAELDFFEKGGYGRSVRTPWQPTSVFLDSPTCINFSDPDPRHPCKECLLIEFVPPSARSEATPCHRIPLSRDGRTVESISQKKDQEELEEAVKAWLRATISGIEEARAQLAAARARGWEKPATGRGKRRRILIVDDDEQVLMDVERRLESEGYDTTTAWSGQEALRMLRLASFDLLLLDDYLSKVSSEEVLRQLRSVPDRPSVLVMWAAPPAETATVRSTRLGASGYVDKRHLDELVQSVARCLSARPTASPDP